MSNLKRGFVFAACALTGLSVFAKDLVWNGGAGDAWTLSAPVWLDGSTPCAWENGATAVFSGSGLVTISDEVEAAGIRFTTSGTMLVGSGLIRLSGALDVAEGTENAMAVRLYGAPSMSKTGAGTVALAYTRGALAIEAGKVYAGGFNMRDTAVTVAPGAELKLVTPEGRDKPANLLSNASFEAPVIGGYKYVGVNELSPWKRGAANYIVLATAASQKSTWGNELATVPDGNQIAAVQMNGELTQTVTVPADGYYDLSFYMFRRGSKTQYAPHQLYISVDGAFLTPMFDIFWSGLPQFVDTGAVYLKAGSHSLTIAGEGFWGDTTTFIDDLVFAPAVLTDATAIPSSSGTVVDVATGEQTFDGTYTLTADGHGICHITKTGAGKAVFSQDVNVPGWTVYDVEGEAEYAGTLTGAKNLYKRGAGSLTLTTPGACAFKIQNGDLRVKNYTGSMSVSYLVDQGATAGFYPGLGSGDASLGDMLFQGGGACLIGTLGDGRTLTVSGAQLYAPRAVFDVGAGDTIKLGDLRAYLVGNRKDYVDTDAVKLGPGTLELTKKPSCYPPTTFTVRAGTLVADFTDEPWNLSYTRRKAVPSASTCAVSCAGRRRRLSSVTAVRPRTRRSSSRRTTPRSRADVRLSRTRARPQSRSTCAPAAPRLRASSP